MAIQNVTLLAAADVFQVHPRTICRALTGKHNTYWYEDINENVYAVRDIAKAYNMPTAVLQRCIEGREALLKPNDAAKMLGIRPRTFRQRVRDDGNPRKRNYGKCGHGGIVRYVRSKIIEEAIATKE
jgi:hypothetical protein